MSIDMNTDRGGERLLNPHSARDTKFSSDNKGFSQLPSSSKNTNTKPSIPKYRMEKNEVKEVLINRIEKEEQMVYSQYHFLMFRIS